MNYDARIEQLELELYALKHAHADYTAKISALEAQVAELKRASEC